MAEAVALVASVLALAQTGWDVAKGLFDLASEAGTAGESVRIFANDLWLFVETIGTVEDLLAGSTPVSGRAQSTIEELLEIAIEQIVGPFQRLLSRSQPLLSRWKDSPNKIRQVSVRIQWAFTRKQNILFYHAALKALKSNVSLLLQTLSLRGQNPPHIQFILRSSIKDTKASLQGAPQNSALRLLRSASERRDDRHTIVRKPVQSSSSTSIEGALSARSSTNSLHRLPQSSKTTLVLMTDVDILDEGNEVANSLAGISLLESDPMDDSKEEQEEHEEQLEAIGAIRALQKRVVRLAEESTTATESAPEQANVSQASPMTTSLGDDASPIQTARVAFEKHPMGRVVQRQGAQGAAKHQGRQELDNKHGAARNRKETIHFVDSLDSAFEIPRSQVSLPEVSTVLKSCSSLPVNAFDAMHAFIAREYTGVEHDQLSLPALSAHDQYYGYPAWNLLQHIQSAVQAGLFTYLYSEDDMPYKMVIPEYWEDTVKPRGRVRILLDCESFRKYTLMELIRAPTLGRIRVAQRAAIARMNLKKTAPTKKKSGQRY